MNNLLRDIYAIQHNVTGRIYVGITEDVGKRVQHHFSALKGNKHINLLMQKDYNQYGFDYSVFILECDVPLKDRWKEKFYIHALNTDDPDIGYNTHDPSATRIKGWRYVDGCPKPNKKGDK